MTDLPVGTVTFLLADVEGSTQLWEAGAEAMSASMDRLGDLTDETVARHVGARPVEQGEGDSFVAGFSRASDAVSCALDLQLAFANESWPGPPLNVRIGLHTGEARVRDDGKNYAGEAMNRAARLRNLGHGGQTLLSNSTYEVAVDALPKDVSLRDLGPHRLRDLQRPDHVWQLCHPDLEDEFPKLRSLESMPNNLPAQLTSFVGRAQEMDDVRAMLSDHRVVTLTGSGGVGKTRLAIESAATLLDDYLDGVWVVDLAPTNRPELVPKAVAAAANISEIATRATIDLLLIEFRGKRTLIVLDNCEHLTEACADLVEQLVRECANVTILATSREPLGVAGELAWRVPSLETTDDPASITETDAGKLFCDRAITVRPNFKVSETNASALVEICRQLDGIPLAIQLAAALVRVLTPTQIAAGLSDRFQLLTGGGPRALPRQRTLEASVDWSYTQLSEAEQRLLRRLSVFAGGFTLDAAEAVCAEGEADTYGVLNVLTALVDKSLVQVDDEGEVARYSLLETIRQYAAQKVVDVGEGQTIGDRHLRYYADLAHRTDLADEVGVVPNLQELRTEHDNFRSALDWGVRRDLAEESLRLASSLAPFWDRTANTREGYRRLQAVLGLNDGSPEARCRALAAASRLSWATDPTDGLRYGKEAVALARDLGDVRLLAGALVGLGRNRIAVDPQAAEAMCEEAILVAEEAGVGWAEFAGRLFLGWIAMVRGELPAAKDWFESALALPGGDSPGRRAYVTIALGWAMLFEGEIFAAERYFRQSLDDGCETDATYVIGDSLSGLAEAAATGGDLERARSLIDDATGYMEKIGWPTYFYLLTKADVLAAEGDDRAALPELESAKRLAELQQNAEGAFLVEAIIGGIETRFDLEAGRARLDRILDPVRGAKGPMALSWALHFRGLVARLEGDDAAAESLLHEAVAIGQRAANKIIVICALEALAGLAARTRDIKGAARVFGAAAAARDKTGFTKVDFLEGFKFYNSDLAATRDALGDAFEGAWAEGALMSLEDAVAYAQRGRGERKRPSSGWDSLTPAESDVVRLVAEGMSNKEIAEKLFVSHRTVQTHLTHVYSKLGISSRVQLVQEALTR